LAPHKLAIFRSQLIPDKCSRNYCTFSKTAFTVNSDPGTTVNSRFHCAKPGIETITSCLPVLTFATEGVLPMYCPSTEISEGHCTPPIPPNRTIVAPLRLRQPLRTGLLRQGFVASDDLKKQLLDTVRRELGPVAVIGELNFVDRVPKTRSGKIMRRVLRTVVQDKNPGDITSIEDEDSGEEARQAWHQMREQLKSAG
jgi:hypothetical protein